VRRTAAVLAIALAAAVARADAAWPPALHVVRVDAENHRLFVAPAEVALAAPRAFLADVARAVAAHEPDWDDAWSVSFFSDAALAKYKTELAGSGGSLDAWARGYLAEFDRATRTLVRHPALPGERRIEQLELP
jgi:hypothetical protein